MTKRRSSVRFVGNSPELDEEFRRILESAMNFGIRNTHVVTAFTLKDDPSLNVSLRNPVNRQLKLTPFRH